MPGIEEEQAMIDRFQSVEELYEAARNFRPGNDDLFRLVVSETLRLLTMLQLELAAFLGVNTSTVSRWVHGTHVPSRRLQVSLVKDISRRIQHNIQNRPVTPAKKAA